MRKKAFFLSCIIILFTTLGLKVAFMLRANGSASVPLHTPDSVAFGLERSKVIWMAVGIEAMAIVLLLSRTSSFAKALTIGITAHVFLSYRILNDLFSDQICPCLGGDWRWISEHRFSYNILMYCSLIYMFAGSFAILKEGYLRVPENQKGMVC